MKARALFLVICLSVVLGLGSLSSYQPPPELLYPLTVCPEGPPRCDFPAIQAAIEAAIPEALILVYPGTYRENLTLNKSIRLAATEHGQVRIQGTPASEATPEGEITLTLQVEGEREILLEGITILGLTNPGREADSAIRSTGVFIQGQGILNLKLVGVQIVNSTFGIFCRSQQVSVEILLERSRLAANSGTAFRCEVGQEEKAIVQIKDSVISGNWLGILVRHNTKLLLEESVFTRNVNAVAVGGTSAAASNTEVKVWHSRFLNNVAHGIGMEGNGSSRLEVRESLFWGDQMGVSVVGKMALAAYDNEFRGFQYFGLRMALGTQVYLAGNTFKGNEDGMSISPSPDPREEAHSLLEARGNRFVGNKGCGVRIVDVQKSLRALRMEAQGNEFSENGQDLCPEAYPWPPDFIKRP